MPRYTKRLLIACCMSSACYFGTIFWYNSQTVGGDRYQNKEAIAKLQMHVNEVQRKPLARVIWEELAKDDNLYTGESIRTTQDSEAKIYFLKTGAVIELEPDSQVVLEETEDGIALDFLKGNLFVKGGKKDGSPGITLKSGNKKIDLNNADISLSKSKKGAVDLQVFGGEAKVTGEDGKTTTLDESQSGVITDKGVSSSDNIIKVISPKPGEPIYIDPRNKEPISFKWESLPEGYTVYMEGGRKRNKLKRTKSRFATGKAGELKIPLKVGKFYWRLIAVPNKQGLDERKSKVIPAQIFAKIAPMPLEPENEKKVVLKSNNPNVKFKWATPTEYQNFFIEVAKDKGLKEQVAKQTIEPQFNFTDLELKDNGTYYWRITGFMDINGKATPVSSGVKSFTLQVGIKVVPPVLRSPMPAQKISFSQIDESGLFLSWDTVPGIKKYKVTIKNLKKYKVTKDGKTKGLYTKEAFTSPVKLKALKPGSYEWSVTSVSPEDDAKESKPSEVRKFSIEELPGIQWADGREPANFYYVTSKPYLRGEWKNLPANVKVASWRVRYAESGFLTDEVKWVTTKKLFIRKYIEKDGEYDVEVEALNSKGKPIARSSVKTINVQEKPILPAPQFGAEAPDAFNANRSGNVSINWDPVEGAEHYKLLIKNNAGKVLKKTTVKRNTASLKRLKPGNYKISIQAVDKHERNGQESAARELEVPKTSNIRAPKIKSFKVK